MNYYSEMKAVRSEICGMAGMASDGPPAAAALRNFWQRAKFSASLIFLEKEILTFAVLQWACIGAGYLLWVQMLGWIPDHVWQRAAAERSAGLPDLVLLLWSFVCVGVTAFPLGVLSGCMGAVHFLHRQGRESTIVECLKMVLPRVWPLWIFHWIDGWWTVTRILDRLPKKNDRSGPAARALREAMYYAWKLATIGILPGLVTGRGLADAGRRSVDLVRVKFADAAFLRGGYSAACWVLGVGAYIATILLFWKFPELASRYAPVSARIYRVYFWAAVPILSAAGVVLLFLRPIYIISSCDIYANYVRERGENLMLPPPPGAGRKSDMAAFVAACVLAAGLLLAVKYRFELGLMGWLSR